MNRFMELVVSCSVLLCCVTSHPTREDHRIVNGSAAPETLAPYMVSLRLRENNSHLCGGSIISPRTVLTAAHCLTDLTPRGLFAVVGTTTLNAGGFTYTVLNFKIHEEFRSTTLVADIAVVLVNQSIVFSSAIQPIGLPMRYTDAGETLTLTGWGITSFPGVSPNQLQTIQTTSISVQRCKTLVPTTIYETQLCVLNEPGQGACYADSGSPLVQKGKQVGLVSWAYPCATRAPDVYTRLTSYLPWIFSNIVY